MPKTLCPEDFYPDEGVISLLKIWGEIKKNPCGDKLINEEFITRKDVIAEFIDYWLNRHTGDKKKKLWQKAYVWHVKNIAWPNELSDFEKNRHRRSDSGSNGFNSFSYMTEHERPKPAQKLKYKLPERPEVEPMTREEALKQLKEMRR